MPPAQATKQLQVPPVQHPAQREHIMQLQTRKHVDRDCGTNSKKKIHPNSKKENEIHPYKMRHLVKKYA